LTISRAAHGFGGLFLQWCGLTISWRLLRKQLLQFATEVRSMLGPPNISAISMTLPAAIMGAPSAMSGIVNCAVPNSTYFSRKRSALRARWDLSKASFAVVSGSPCPVPACADGAHEATAEASRMYLRPDVSGSARSRTNARSLQGGDNRPRFGSPPIRTQSGREGTKLRTLRRYIHGKILGLKPSTFGVEVPDPLCGNFNRTPST